MQVIEEFIHIVGLGMKDFHNAYLMTGNLGENQSSKSFQDPEHHQKQIISSLALSSTFPDDFVKIHFSREIN